MSWSPSTVIPAPSYGRSPLRSSCAISSRSSSCLLRREWTVSSSIGFDEDPGERACRRVRGGGARRAAAPLRSWSSAVTSTSARAAAATSRSSRRWVPSSGLWWCRSVSFPIPPAGGIVSSTGIRRLIAAGELGEAARLLGRPHEVRGPMLAIPAGSAEVSGMGATRAFCVDVPPEILRPPAGTYGVLVGLASSEGREALPPVPGRAVVPADEHAPLQVARIWHAGERDASGGGARPGARRWPLAIRT